MELTLDAMEVMSCTEMRDARRLSGASLKELACESAISIAQLSEYENGHNGLRVEQVSKVREILMRRCAERGAKIASIIAREKAAELAAVS